MKLDVPGIAMAFEDLPIGSFFMFERAHREFGICVSDGQRLGAIILSTPERSGGSIPWLAIGGLPQDSVVSFGAATLRANVADITTDTNQYGNLISAGSAFYMPAAEGFGNFRTFNVSTGLLEQMPRGTAAIAYARWSVGLMVDATFEAIFSFRPQAAA
jgi:hypothetical protein